MFPKIYKSPFPSVPIPSSSIFTHLFSSSCNIPSSTPVFIDASSGTTLSRSTLKSLSLSLAFGLTKTSTIPIKLTKGDVILIFSPNTLAWPVVLFGAVAAGLRCTLANSTYTSNELRHQWEDSGAKVAFVHPCLVDVVREMFRLMGDGEDELRRRVVVASTEWLTGIKDEGPNPADVNLVYLPTLLEQGSLSSEVPFSTREEVEETVYLCYSSGTTGKPKGVETTHKNMVALVNIVTHVFPKLFIGQDMILGMLPFYHIYGIAKLLHFPFYSGIPVVIMPRFEPVACCAHIEKYKTTVALVVPPILLAMAQHPATTKYDLRTLKLLFSGGAPLGSTLINAVREKLMSVGANPAVTQAYGLTETSPTSHMLLPQDCLRKLGAVGLLLPNLEARLVLANSADGKGVIDAKAGEPGELWMRGPTVMKGYLNNVKATRECITSDGWFQTGDIAIRDNDGFYTIVDRRKELIKYKGSQVSPAELESVLLQHPDITDVAVIGVDSKEQATELPRFIVTNLFYMLPQAETDIRIFRAYVMHANPASLKGDSDKLKFGESVQEWIRTRVAPHKFLRGGVVVIDVVPKSAAGKLLRRELRELAKRELRNSKARL